MKERCKPCKEWAEHFYRNHFRPKGMSFIKAMDSGFSQGMFIPVKFVKNVKRKLPDNMSLRDPNGNLWSIKLLKVPGSLLVKDGWKEFVDANHVARKDFLVFRYDGKACFDVLIFDQSGYEKKEASSSVVRRSKAVECPQVIKQEYYDSSEEKVSASFEEEHGSHSLINITNYRGRYIQRGSSRKMTKYVKQVSKRRQVTEEEEEEAVVLKSALAFKTVRPSFRTVMRPSHVSKRFFMSVPSHFASQHIKHRKQIVCLRVANRNKEWHVRYVSNGGSWGFTSQQWQLFVFDNKLEEGDVCVFELIASQSEFVIMHVHIFPVVASATTAVKKET